MRTNFFKCTGPNRTKLRRLERQQEWWAGALQDAQYARMAFAFGKTMAEISAARRVVGEGGFTKVIGSRGEGVGRIQIQSSIRFRATQFAARLSRLGRLALSSVRLPVVWEPLSSAIIQLIPGNIIHEWPLRSSLPIMMTTSWMGSTYL